MRQDSKVIDMTLLSPWQDIVPFIITITRYLNYQFKERDVYFGLSSSLS